MNKTRIAIAEPSLIVRTGIAAVLKRFTALPIEVLEISEVENIELLLMRHMPKILIINPTYLDNNTLNLFKRNPRLQNIKYVALQSTIFCNNFLKNYDQTLNINLEAEQIREIISKLVINHADANSTTLSDREKDIIIGIAQGLTNKEIADKLYISTNTVMTHRKNISRKLNIHSPAGLILYAIANHLIEVN